MLVSCASLQEWWPIKHLYVRGHGEGGGHNFPKTCRRDQVLGWRTRALEEWQTVGQAPNHLEEASKPKGGSSLGVTIITWRQLPPAAPGFRELLAAKSGVHPMDDVDLPLGIPWETQLHLSSPGSMQVVITQNTLTGELQYHYQTRIISQTSLHLALPGSSDQPHPTGIWKNPEQINHSWTHRWTLNWVSTCS